MNSTTPPPAPAMAGNATGSPAPEGSAIVAASGAPRSQWPHGAGPQGGSSQVAATTKGASSDNSPHFEGSQAAATVPAATKTMTLTSEVVYTTVCSTNPAHLVTITATVTYCPNDPSHPSVPQSTMTQSCNGCGVNGQSVVTLTIPLAFVSPESSSSQADPPVNSPASAAHSGLGSQAASRVGLQATPVFPVNGTMGSGNPTWTPVATPTFSGTVQVASAPKMSGWNVVTTIVACVYGTVMLLI